ncbi:uncharacterized protein BJ171DRAFT_510550 [Polychytrium aggregatum]|uniref:uncharacterized protein n=1 Tax=Polychytrium aggregatum TaxID=110093 RepID=UPI0022FEE911|nr:uncharacterized protein BJ171DRAFT_510550 [Polychytrium aggregatum]KAI9203388.1 hypothetical protein BJ171DRAFT_510550 [Polychytrium aggregatum]
MTPPLVALYALGSAGDVLPMIALGRALQIRRGYRVRVIATEKWRQRISEEGLEYFDHQGEPIMCTSDGYDPNEVESLVANRGTVDGFRALMRASVPILEFLYKTADRHLDGVSLAILIHVSILLQDDCQKRSIPFISCHFQPGRATQDYPPPFLGQCYDPVDLQATATNMISWGMSGLQALSIFSRMRQERRVAIGLRRSLLPPSMTVYYDLAVAIFEHRRTEAAMPYLCTFSTALLPIPSDVQMHDCFVQTGPLLLDHEQCAKPFSPPKDLESFLATGTIVYFGYGSLQKIGPSSTKEIDHMSAWLDTIQELEFLGVKVKAIFSFSWGHDDVTLDSASTKYVALRHRLDELIKEKRVYRLLGSFPHTFLFPRCHVAVHHGGAGTFQAAAKYALPSVIVPHFMDQPFMASVAKHHGIATVIDLDEFSTHRLVEGLKDILVDRPDFYEENCDWIASEMAREDPMSSAVELVEKVLAK